MSEKDSNTIVVWTSKVVEDLILKTVEWERVSILHKSLKCSSEVNQQEDSVDSMMILVAEVINSISAEVEEASPEDSHRVGAEEVVPSHLTLDLDLTSNFSKSNNNFNN